MPDSSLAPEASAIVDTPKEVSYRWFVLVILTIVYTFNFIDGQILVILEEPIKA